MNTLIKLILVNKMNYEILKMMLDAKDIEAMGKVSEHETKTLEYLENIAKDAVMDYGLNDSLEIPGYRLISINGKVIGFIETAYRASKGKEYVVLYDVYVKPECRGNDYGKKAILTILNRYNIEGFCIDRWDFEPKNTLTYLTHIADTDNVEFRINRLNRIMHTFCLRNLEEKAKKIA